MAAESEFGVEFWEKGKHVITIAQTARSSLDAWDYAEGKLSDMSFEEVSAGREPYTYDEIRIISPKRFEEINKQILEGI